MDIEVNVEMDQQEVRASHRRGSTRLARAAQKELEKRQQLESTKGKLAHHDQFRDTKLTWMVLIRIKNSENEGPRRKE